MKSDCAVVPPLKPASHAGVRTLRAPVATQCALRTFTARVTPGAVAPPLAGRLRRLGTAFFPWDIHAET